MKLRDETTAFRRRRPISLDHALCIRPVGLSSLLIWPNYSRGRLSILETSLRKHKYLRHKHTTAIAYTLCSTRSDSRYLCRSQYDHAEETNRQTRQRPRGHKASKGPVLVMAIIFILDIA